VTAEPLAAPPVDRASLFVSSCLPLGRLVRPFFAPIKVWAGMVKAMPTVSDSGMAVRAAPPFPDSITKTQAASCGLFFCLLASKVEPIGGVGGQDARPAQPAPARRGRITVARRCHLAVLIRSGLAVIHAVATADDAKAYLAPLIA
jgi:hypothetical protein